MTIRTILPAAMSFCLFALPGTANDLTDMSAGSIVTNVVTIGETQIPLPKGKWELKLVRAKRHQEFGKIGRAFLTQDTEESGFQAVEMISNIDSCAPLGWTKHTCGRKDTHHNESTGDSYNKRTGAECWNVNHRIVNPNAKFTKGFWKKYNNDINEMRRSTSKNKTTFLTNEFRWADQCDFVSLWYFVHPEHFGFPSESNAWKESAWHRDAVGEDPRRKSLVTAVTDVGRELREAVKRGFDGKLDGWSSDIGLNFE